MTGLRVIRPGMSSTVQDGGRPGWRRFGVPAGGAWDRGALALANLLVGNREEAASIELTMLGGEFEATGPIAIALAGSAMPARIESGGNIRELWMPCASAMDVGDRLILGAAKEGVRAYLSVRGGWQTPEVMGSRSSERRLVAGDFLGSIACEWFDSIRIRPGGESNAGAIRYADGIEWSEIDPSAEFRVGNDSNRMGLRLEGPCLKVESPAERRSTPVIPGTMQVAGGRLIVLGVACGTMGGYPQVGQVISADLDRLGQVRPGDRIRFERVSIEEARAIDAESRTRRARYLSRVRCVLRPWPGDTGASAVHDRIAIDPAED